MAKALFQEIDTVSTRELLRASRSARLPKFLGLRADPGPVLDALDIAIVGVGSVGRNVALNLARQHVGTLRLIDRGRFKPESLLTQPIGPDDIGQPKAANAAELCKQISPSTRTFAFDGPVQDLDMTALADCSLVVLATDNLAAEVEVGQRCLNLGIPLEQASVHGDTLVAQVRFFGNRAGEGACPACGFGASEWAHLNRETTFSCEGLAAGRTIAMSQTAPTMSVSFLCSLAADLALMQIFRHVLKLGPAVEDSLVEYCGYTHRTVTAPLTRNPECPCEHLVFETRPAPRPLADCTPRELAEDFGDASVTVDDLAFVEQGTCRVCGKMQPVQRFIEMGQLAGQCADCEGDVFGQPLYTHRTAPAALLGSVLDRPLRDCGVASPRSVVVRGSGRAVLIRER